MAGYENIKDENNNRTPDERRELAIRAGKASGEARRRKADFRRTLNMLLTAEIDNPEWTPVLEALGLDSTLESAVNAAVIKKALAGNVRAYEAIRDTLGQTLKSDLDIEEQLAKIVHLKAQAEALQPDTNSDQPVKYAGIPSPWWPLYLLRLFLIYRNMDIQNMYFLAVVVPQSLPSSVCRLLTLS